MISLTKTNDKGIKQTWYSHSSFLTKNQIDKIKNIQQTFSGYAKFSALLLSGSFLFGIHKYQSLSKMIPKKIHPFVATIGLFGISWFGFNFIFKSFSEKYYLQIIQSEGALPLWKNINNVVNLDRAFFDLDDTRNNQINILHNGLSIQTCAKLYPDLILGQIPIQIPHLSHNQVHTH